MADEFRALWHRSGSGITPPMRHPDTRRFTPDEQAIYDEWLWLLTRWGTHDVDEAHELALHRAAGASERAPAPGDATDRDPEIVA